MKNKKLNILLFFMFSFLIVSAQEDKSIEDMRKEIFGEASIDDEGSTSTTDIKSRVNLNLDDYPLENSIKSLISNNIYIVESNYFKADKDGNRYITDTKEPLRFKSLGFVDNGVLVIDPSVLSPWSYDTSYIASKGLLPAVDKTYYKPINGDKSYVEKEVKKISSGLGVISIKSTGGLKSKAFTSGDKNNPDNIYVISYGYVEDKLVSYMDSYNELDKLEGAVVSQFFNEFIGALVIETSLQESGMAFNPVGFITSAPVSDKKNLVQFMKFSSNDIKAISDSSTPEKKETDKKKKKKKSGGKSGKKSKRLK